MITPPTPTDEAARLDDLHRLRVLDSPPEERFERIVRLASALLDAPMVAVSLVDAERQWLKARQGLAEGQTTRERAFCAHAIADEAPIFEVPDALLDPRFHDHPIVVDAPRVRWYAGRPLRGLGGFRVGTLCVLDRRPRSLDARERQVLEDLAALVESELHLVRLAEQQADLVAAIDRAEAAARAKSGFLAFVSHEIRNPAASVSAAVELLDTTETSPKQARYLEICRRGATSLLHLLDNLLDLARAESGQLELESIPFDVTELARGVVHELEGRALTKGVALAVTVDPALEPLRRGDSERLRHVLVNLVGNALKFTEDGGVSLTVSAADGDHVAFAVRDTGPGIPAERLDAIFESYTQGDSSVRRRHGGAGLGLAIVKSFVTHMGGDVCVESVVGAGSTFSFAVPLPRAPAT